MVKEMFEVNVASILAFVLLVASSANVSSKIDTNGCILPDYPMQGRWAINNDTKLRPKETVQNGISITVTCNNQHKLNGSSLLICNNGTWSEEIGQCLDLCPPIFETYSTRITCTTNGKSSNCTTPTNSTIATIECAPFYENRELNNTNSIIICENGRWNKDIRFCSAVCGLEPKEGLYPWNVLIYETNFFKLGPSCAGTLLDDKTILTAASCVSDATDTTFSRSDINLFDMRIVAGKSSEKYENPDPDPDVQYRTVQDVFVPDTYNGFLGKLFADIAVIIVKNPFKITRRVYPACLDLLQRDKEKISFNKKFKVAAPLKSLKSSNKFEIDLHLLGELDCRAFLQSIRDKGGVSNYNNHFITNDKYCAKNITSSYNAPDCNNRIYQGVGIISKTDKYSVVGVTSLGSAHSDCYNNAFTLITRVSDYSSFISKIFNLYSTKGLHHIQPFCGIKRSQTLIFDNSTIAKVDYPWQVAIYKTFGTSKDLICGGSLISPRIILTAADCVADRWTIEIRKEDYIVAVGKYFPDFDDPRDKNYSQFSALEEIIVPTEYADSSQNFPGDIAILISEISFDVTPICLDWESKYEDQFLTPNSTGFIAGWEFTHRNQRSSNELTDLEIRPIDVYHCKRDFYTFSKFSFNDKLCFEFLDKENNGRRGKSGYGIIFKNTHDSRYYLVGIACYNKVCAYEEQVFYTQVSKYIISFILQKTRLYWN